MENIGRNFYLFALALLINKCGPLLNVSTDFEKTCKFTNYRTFGLYNSNSLLSAISQLNKDRLTAEVWRGIVFLSDSFNNLLLLQEKVIQTNTKQTEY